MGIGRKEKVASVALAFVLLLGGAMALCSPAAEVTVTATEVTPTTAVTLTSEDGDGAGTVHARTRVLGFRPVTAGEPGGDAPDGEVELSLPVSAAACARLVAKVGGACGGSGEISPRPPRPLTIAWPDGGRAVVETSTASYLSVSETPFDGGVGRGAWNLELGAGLTKLGFECPEQAGFTLVLDGRVVSQRCEQRGVAYRTRFELPAGLVPEVFLSGLSAPSSLEAHSHRAEVQVDRGILFVGADERMRRGGDPVAVESESPTGLYTRIDAGGTGRAFDVLARTATAEEVTVGGDSQIHTYLSEHLDLWLLVLGMVGGTLFGLLIERVPAQKK
ncbi:MAG TPA: hypothetical protein VFX85_08345 [Solirubrobacterales bacterium]|nr:hypothetical protein [Solirubrobacterales bacterium]